MRIDLLGKAKQYKGNLHAHSTLSDGVLTPEEAKAAYLARLASEGVLAPETKPEPPAVETVVKTLTLGQITPVTTSGETYLYMTTTDESGKRLILRARVAEDETVLFLAPGDTVKFTLTKTAKENVFDVVSFVLPE